MAHVGRRPLFKYEKFGEAMVFACSWEAARKKNSSFLQVRLQLRQRSLYRMGGKTQFSYEKPHITSFFCHAEHLQQSRNERNFRNFPYRGRGKNVVERISAEGKATGNRTNGSRPCFRRRRQFRIVSELTKKRVDAEYALSPVQGFSRMAGPYVQKGFSLKIRSCKS